MPDFPPPPRREGLRLAGQPALVLARRRAVEPSEEFVAARERIGQLVAATRSPFAPGEAVPDRAAELERSLRALEQRLEERERVAAELEARLAERERELAEMEALLQAREKVLDAERRAARGGGAVSAEEKAALEALKAELQRQEASLREAKAALKERETFLEDSENKLFEKVQAQQEKETELEQREEDLRLRERRIRALEAGNDPAAAAALAAEKARPRTFDEFSE